MKVSVDQKKCIGCGACESQCPNFFEVVDGKARVKKGGENSKDSCLKEAQPITRATNPTSHFLTMIKGKITSYLKFSTPSSNLYILFLIC